MAITTNLETLRQKSELFLGLPKELQSLIDCLDYELSHHEKIGVGLSAIQINIPYRVAIVRIRNKVKIQGQNREILKSYNLYNAEIISKSQEYVFKGEACLSLPGQVVDTKRYNNIEVRNGDGKLYQFSGFEAVVVQHELAHWEGKLIFDYEVDKENRKA